MQVNPTTNVLQRHFLERKVKQYDFQLKEVLRFSVRSRGMLKM